MKLWIAFFLSGAAALGYQVLWSRLLAISLGHEFRAVVAVVASFFFGLALGAFFSGNILRRLGRRAFAFLEIGIGAWGLLTPLLVREVESGLALFPATIAMGATLPAMARAGKKIAGVYAANTFGAVAGCLLVAFGLMPALGIQSAIWICAATNFVAAALAWTVASQPETAPKPGLGSEHHILFVTGFLAIAFEIVGVRLLSQSLENTVFSFAVILAVYLLGQAIGAAVLVRNNFTLLGVSVAVSIWPFRFSGAIYETMRSRFGDSIPAVATAEFLTTAAIFLAPTIAMGGLFAHLAARAGDLGKALGWNSLGACLGGLVVPLLFPVTGAFWILALLAAGYFAMIRKWDWRAIAGAAVAVLAIGVSPKSLTLAEARPGTVLREIREGRMATVSVTETPDRHRTLFVNNRFQMGGTAAAIPELRHGHIPLLLHPNPGRALFLGLGTGVTMSSARAHPGLLADGVELLPEVAAVMTNFVEQPPGNIVIADARRFVRETTTKYDVVVADLFHPAQDGAGFLYTKEHFDRIRAVLSEQGLFCQWLPLHQLDLPTFRIVCATFLEVFPEASAWMLRFNVDAPVIGLISRFHEAPVEARLTDGTLAAELKRVALGDSLRLLGCYMAGPKELRAFAGGARINRDLFPLVMFEAPRFSFQRKAPSYERFIGFLDQVGLVTPNADPRLRRFIEARNIYLRGLVEEAKGQSEPALEAYLASALRSEDFTSGYAQCLVVASAVGKSNPARAREILEKLIAAQPNRTAAREMLERLGR